MKMRSKIIFIFYFLFSIFIFYFLFSIFYFHFSFFIFYFLFSIFYFLFSIFYFHFIFDKVFDQDRQWFHLHRWTLRVHWIQIHLSMNLNRSVKSIEHLRCIAERMATFNYIWIDMMYYDILCCIMIYYVVLYSASLKLDDSLYEMIFHFLFSFSIFIFHFYFTFSFYLWQSLWPRLSMISFTQMNPSGSLNPNSSIDEFE